MFFFLHNSLLISVAERNALVDEYRFTFPSVHAPINERQREYAAVSFPAGRPLLEALDPFLKLVFP